MARSQSRADAADRLFHPRSLGLSTYLLHRPARPGLVLSADHMGFTNTKQRQPLLTKVAAGEDPKSSHKGLEKSRFTYIISLFTNVQ